MPDPDTPRQHRPHRPGRRQIPPATVARQTREPSASKRGPSIAALLETPGAMLTRSHLRTLGLERRAIDAVFRALPVISLPGYSRPMIRAADYTAFVEESIYRDDRVRPTQCPHSAY
jgi:hypothetical protein